jgi:hypothetical protein
MRRRLDTMAEQNSRTISQQTEVLLEHALNGGGLSVGVSPASAKKCEATRQQAPLPGEDESSLLELLKQRFGRDAAALLFVLGYAIVFAELDSIAWSRDVVERTRRFPAVKAGAGATIRQMMKLGEFLIESSPSWAAEQRWLFDDPYVFGQVADAARSVLEMIAPEGERSPPPPPRGINPEIATVLMSNIGESYANWAIGEFTADERSPGGIADLLGNAEIARLRHYLGESVVARLKQALSAEGLEWPSAPTGGQKESP